MTHKPPASPEPTPFSRRRDAIRNRALLLAAARQVFAKRGLEASMDEIAHQAGLGVGTAYRHFANKYELANAIFDDVVEHILDAAEKVDTSPDPWLALCDAIEQTLTAQTNNRAIREIVLATNQDDWAHHDILLLPLRSAFKRAAQAGAIRTDVHYSDLVMMLIMLCSLTDQAADISPTLWRRYLPSLLDGIRPGHAPMPAQALTDEQLRDTLVSGLLKHC